MLYESSFGKNNCKNVLIFTAFVLILYIYNRRMDYGKQSIKLCRIFKE